MMKRILKAIYQTCVCDFFGLALCLVTKFHIAHVFCKPLKISISIWDKVNRI